MKVILPIAALLVCAAPAHAAEYRVYACDGPDDGPLSMRPFTAFEVPEQTTNHDDLCREPNGVASFTFSSPAAVRGGWQLQAPPGATLTRLRWSGGISGVDGTGVRVELDTERGAVAVWSQDLRSDLRVFALPAGARNVALRATCHGAPCFPGPRTTIRALGAALEDPSAPTATGVAGLAGTQHGAAALTFAASDAGSGVHRAALDVDGAVHATAAGDCAALQGDDHGFQSTQPCPAGVPVELDWVTAGVRDGAHQVRATLEDAAGNRSTVFGPATVITDNAPPVAGTVTVSGAAATLTATPAGFDGQDVTYAYRWQRCDPVCDDIDGATHARYTPATPETVRAVVTASDRGGATTVASAPFAAAPVPSATPTPVSIPAPPLTTTTVAAPAPLTPAATACLTATACARVTLSRRTIKLRYGRRVEVRGRIATAGGAPLAGATLDVLSRVRKPGAKTRREGGIGSATDGRFTYVAPAGPSRDLTIGGRTVTLLVSASGTFTATRKGARVTFRGRVRGGHVPRGGVLVEIRGRRGVVALARTDGRGGYRVTTTATRQAFRARTRKDSSWPFAGAPVGSPVSV